MYAELEPKAIREFLLTQGAEEWCEQLLEGVRRRERASMLLYAKTVNLVAPDLNLGALVIQLGARDEQHARSLIDGGKKLEAMMQDVSASLEDLEDDAVQVLRMIFMKNPGRRSAIMARLGSAVHEIAENGEAP